MSNSFGCRSPTDEVQPFFQKLTVFPKRMQTNPARGFPLHSANVSRMHPAGCPASHSASIVSSFAGAGSVPCRRHVDSINSKNVDRKSTRLNSSHGYISYAVFCLKKKNRTKINAHYTLR